MINLKSVDRYHKGMSDEVLERLLAYKLYGWIVLERTLFFKDDQDIS